MLISFTVFCNFINLICCWLYSCHDLKLELFPFVFDPYHMDLEQHECEQIQFLGELSVW